MDIINLDFYTLATAYAAVRGWLGERVCQCVREALPCGHDSKYSHRVKGQLWHFVYKTLWTR